MARPTHIDLQVENKQHRYKSTLEPVLEKAAPDPVDNPAYILAILTTLGSADILTTSQAILQITNPSLYLAPTPIQILCAAASNAQAGDVLLMLLLRDSAKFPCRIITSLPESEKEASLNKALVVAVNNKNLWKECVQVLLKYMGKVKIDALLVRALAERGEAGKEVFLGVLERKKGVEFEEWSKGEVVDVVRERFGHVVLGKMVEELGVFSWPSSSDRRYCCA